MDKKTTGWVAYLSWIGFIIAICTGDKKGANFHLNQALVCNIGFTVSSFITGLSIPFFSFFVGGVLNIFVLVCWILGLIAAVNEEEKEIPLLGQIKILKFNDDNSNNTTQNNEKQ